MNIYSQASRLLSEEKDAFLGNSKMSREDSESKNLELRLGPPVQNCIHGAKRMFQDTVKVKVCSDTKPSCKHPCIMKPPSSEKKGPSYIDFSLSEECSFNILEASHLRKEAYPSCVALPRNSQKRALPGPVVGWPPVGSFRKNVASSLSSRQTSEPSTKLRKEGDGEQSENPTSHMFVKIYMDGFPIGRKLNLKAYDSYEKLSSAVNELFRGLLSSQGDASEDGDEKIIEKKSPSVANEEYTLVYEDNEGDSILVGDVPWIMFVSTAKRLRILKASSSSSLSGEP